jgi:hypothetical protein
MYAQISLDCQTRTEYVSCEYCIGKENCKLRSKLNSEQANETDLHLIALSCLPDKRLCVSRSC